MTDLIKVWGPNGRTWMTCTPAQIAEAKRRDYIKQNAAGQWQRRDFITVHDVLTPKPE
jgi:hypothetical protein